MIIHQAFKQHVATSWHCQALCTDSSFPWQELRRPCIAICSRGPRAADTANEQQPQNLNRSSAEMQGQARGARLAHADLSHQLVLVAVHAGELAHVAEGVLQPIRQLERIHIAQPELRTSAKIGSATIKCCRGGLMTCGSALAAGNLANGLKISQQHSRLCNRGAGLQPRITVITGSRQMSPPARWRRRPAW